MKTKKVRPILLATENTHSQLELDGELSYELKQYHCKNPQQLILISLEDEEIKVEDLVYHKRLGIITHYFTNAKAYLDAGEYQKVIATQDQLSPELIKQLVDEYNHGGMKNFEIEMEKWIIYFGDHLNTPIIYTPKLTDGFVTAFKKKPVLYTEEEMYKLTKEAVGLWRDPHNARLYRNKEHHGKWWGEIKNKQQ